MGTRGGVPHLLLLQVTDALCPRVLPVSPSDTRNLFPPSGWVVSLHAQAEGRERK